MAQEDHLQSRRMQEELRNEHQCHRTGPLPKKVVTAIAVESGLAAAAAKRARFCEGADEDVAAATAVASTDPAGRCEAERAENSDDDTLPLPTAAADESRADAAAVATTADQADARRAAEPMAEPKPKQANRTKAEQREKQARRQEAMAAGKAGARGPLPDVNSKRSQRRERQAQRKEAAAPGRVAAGQSQSKHALQEAVDDHGARDSRACEDGEMAQRTELAEADPSAAKREKEKETDRSFE